MSLIYVLRTERLKINVPFKMFELLITQVLFM